MKPYRVDIPQADVDDLRARLAHTRWPGEIPGQGWNRGVPLDYLKDLAGYWADGFDWRAQEAWLNAFPQYVTEVDGQPIHLFHLRSANPDALPLIMTHGWPSSGIEFLRLAEPLKDDFHLVLPTLPGYGFSNPVRAEGWGNIFRVAQAWTGLMERLGYTRYGVQGTDVGSGVAGILRMIDAKHVVGVHINGASPVAFGPPMELEGLSEADRVRAERFNTFQREGMGYFHLQSTRPQTLGYALNDSPAGQLAWIVEKFKEWTDPAKELPEDAVDRDHLLTLISVTWFNGAGAMSANMGYEGIKAWRAMAGQEQQEEPPGLPPLGVALFAADNGIRSRLGALGEVEHWSEYPAGGHFPGMEAPELLAADLRTFFVE
ncbi:MAG: epoxide hydrolase [Nonomuraea sp.]|nr:epoxide hydrolase [Nonomuraea sp.]